VEYAAPMPFWRRMRTVALVVCAAVAAAPRVGLAEETSAANVTAARKHFEKARAYYGQGAYREAVNELEAAHVLDPNAKDLVFNLGVVHEKLSDIEEALKWFRLYTTMDLSPQERDRADAYVRRLEGAKREVDEKQAAQQQPSTEPTAPTGESPAQPRPQQPPSNTTPRTPSAQQESRPPPPPAPPPSGRIDGLTVAAAGLSTAGVVFGAVMGVKAVQDRVSANSVTTSETYPFSTFQNDINTAHREAILADIGFGVALVAGVATAYLYFGRSRAAPAPATGSTTVSVGPFSGGGAWVLKGCF
jgi:tetratricopeptide (TPR) repeat protein